MKTSQPTLDADILLCIFCGQPVAPCEAVVFGKTCGMGGWHHTLTMSHYCDKLGEHSFGTNRVAAPRQQPQTGQPPDPREVLR